MLLRLEVDDPQSLRSVFKNMLIQCRMALWRLFGEKSDDSSSATSSRPNSRAAPRRRVRDTRSPRTKTMDAFVESAVEAVISETLQQEVAELCHQNLRSRITEWSRRLNESKESVKELQELISHEFL